MLVRLQITFIRLFNFGTYLLYIRKIRNNNSNMKAAHQQQHDNSNKSHLHNRVVTGK